ncbi:MAG: hypothetical protein ABR964_04050 [Tepidisphaeraceae bacterium]
MSVRAELIDRIHSHARQVAPAAIEAFVNRLGEDYVRAFDAAAIAKHVAALAGLSAEKPVAVLLEEREGGLIECTVLAFDHDFEFSSITGVMAGTGYSIESSNAFTLRPVRTGPAARRPVRPRVAVRRRDPMQNAVILDHFRGRLLGPVRDFRRWSKIFEPAIVEAIGLLDQEDEPSVERAKRLVNERVTQWLKARRAAHRGEDLMALDAAVEQLPQATRLVLRAPDTPAFLYALSTALSLHGLQIDKTRARSDGGHNIDEIDLVDAYGKPLTDPDRVEQLRGSVLLTQQFAYFLDQSPDPFTALGRFEKLSEKIVQAPKRGQWLELLANPLSMADLAKVLGASDYLWEDFIRWQSDALLEAFERHARGRDLAPPLRTLPHRLEQALAGVKHFEEQRDRLNRFKDHELFLIDLNHILSGGDPDAAFLNLSERLVFLAENLVAAASRLVHEELVRLYGRPRTAAGRDVGFAVFGLGKLGGVALGYASDIELLFLYDEEGSTSGGTRGSLDNGEFFAILTRESCAYILAKREGIFQVDLRLRPFGTNGPLASSRRQFAQYYGPKGQAHPFERLALVRLRWIAGEAKLGFAIEQLRDQLLYDGPPLDMAAVWEISGKMRLQHTKDGRSGQLNSKYTPGALADLEETVQLLQVMHAKDAPQLRTPRLHEAIRALGRAQMLSAAEFETLMGAYQFLRRLINAQRMLRGSARDLFLPQPGAEELLHLARRMNYLPEEESGDVGAMLLADFQRQTKAVRQFIRGRFGR